MLRVESEHRREAIPPFEVGPFLGAASDLSSSPSLMSTERPWFEVGMAVAISQLPGVSFRSGITDHRRSRPGPRGHWTYKVAMARPQARTNVRYVVPLYAWRSLAFRERLR